MFLFTGPPEPWSHRDHVQSSVHWTALRLFDELRYAHLTLQVGCFARGLECRVCPPLPLQLHLHCLIDGTPDPHTFQVKPVPGQRCAEKEVRWDRCCLSSPLSQQYPQ